MKIKPEHLAHLQAAITPLDTAERRNLYLLTVTDLFGGEANFSWVRRYKVTAKSHLGAIQKLAKHTGASWRRSLSDRYDSGGTCCFIEDWISDNTYKAEEL